MDTKTCIWIQLTEEGLAWCHRQNSSASPRHPTWWCVLWRNRWNEEKSLYDRLRWRLLPKSFSMTTLPVASNVSVAFPSSPTARYFWRENTIRASMTTNVSALVHTCIKHQGINVGFGGFLKSCHEIKHSGQYENKGVYFRSECSRWQTWLCLTCMWLCVT